MNPISQTLKFLIRRGHNLCVGISEYTEAQIYFLALVDNGFDYQNKPTNNHLTITNEMSIEEINKKFNNWRQ